MKTNERIVDRYQSSPKGVASLYNTKPYCIQLSNVYISKTTFYDYI